jgi:hypothetical protein
MKAFKNNRFLPVGRILLTGALIFAPLAVVRAASENPPRPETAPEVRLAAVQAALQIGLAYRDWNQAISKKDTDGLAQWARHQTGDYTFKKPDGKSDNSPSIEVSLKNHRVPMKVISKLTLCRDTATALISYRFRDNIADLKAGTDPRDRQDAQRDTWVNTPQGWKLKSSEELPDSK